MTTVRHLAQEICVGLEVYVGGRAGAYLKTAFVLCDDYTELATKLCLLSADPTWSDAMNGGRFKSYHQVHSDLATHVTTHLPTHSVRVGELQDAMKKRRQRRNLFFHSTTLLDLQTTRRDTAEAVCDLLEYCELLFQDDWERAVAATASMGTLILLVRIDQAAAKDATILTRVNEILGNQPRNRTTGRRKGVHLVEFPEDLHALTCARWGGQELIDGLRGVLS